MPNLKKKTFLKKKNFFDKKLFFCNGLPPNNSLDGYRVGTNSWGWGSSSAVEHLSVKRATRVRHSVEALDLERLHVHWCAMDLPQPVLYNWFIKGGTMYYHVCVIMHVKEPQSFIAKSRAWSPGDRLLFLLGQAHQPVSHGDFPRTRQLIARMDVRLHYRSHLFVWPRQPCYLLTTLTLCSL